MRQAHTSKVIMSSSAFSLYDENIKEAFDKIDLLYLRKYVLQIFIEEV